MVTIIIIPLFPHLVASAFIHKVFEPSIVLFIFVDVRMERTAVLDRTVPILKRENKYAVSFIKRVCTRDVHGQVRVTTTLVNIQVRIYACRTIPMEIFRLFASGFQESQRYIFSEMSDIM